jgi:phosphatidylserine decarboxylase
LAVPEPLKSRIAPQAWPATAVLVALAVGAGFFGWFWIAGIVVLLAAANLAFFRNPRRAPAPGNGVVSPADGRVVSVERMSDPDGFVGDSWRVAIFLSVFNVHVNYAPISGKVRGIRRKGSRFLAAFNGKASELNVQSRLDLETDDGVRVGVVQITGLIARRIISYPSEGDSLERGVPYGLICYGSRMEVYVPASARVCVSPGDRVRGATHVLAELAT